MLFWLLITNSSLKLRTTARYYPIIYFLIKQYRMTIRTSPTPTQIRDDMCTDKVLSNLFTTLSMNLSMRLVITHFKPKWMIWLEKGDSTGSLSKWYTRIMRWPSESNKENTIIIIIIATPVYRNNVCRNISCVRKHHNNDFPRGRGGRHILSGK